MPSHILCHLMYNFRLYTMTKKPTKLPKIIWEWCHNGRVSDVGISISSSFVEALNPMSSVQLFAYISYALCPIIYFSSFFNAVARILHLFCSNGLLIEINLCMRGVHFCWNGGSHLDFYVDNITSLLCDWLQESTNRGSTER